MTQYRGRFLKNSTPSWTSTTAVMVPNFGQYIYFLTLFIPGIIEIYAAKTFAHLHLKHYVGYILIYTVFISKNLCSIFKLFES